jgi:two-component system sensor histidine kinase DegS
MATISDDGMGFDTGLSGVNRHAGLKNMETRIKVLKGEMDIRSQPGKGTVLSFNIPFE